MYIEYKNSLGNVIMQGSSAALLRITGLEGLNVVEREYTTAIYAGYDGQETVSSRALPRCITLSVEICGGNISVQLPKIMKILSAPGHLLLGDKAPKRQIFCNQTRIPDIQRVLKGKIASFAVQFVCDSPYFCELKETVTAIYKRTKELSTPFSLPAVFGTTTSGAELLNKGDIPAEPVLKIGCSLSLDTAETVVISNHTTGGKISFTYTPESGEEIVIDIPNRRIYGSKMGNMLMYLDEATFLGDFVLIPGTNQISVLVGDYTSGFTVKCISYNSYSEAVEV